MKGQILWKGQKKKARQRVWRKDRTSERYNRRKVRRKV
jgi:hypothetical protein